MSYNPIPDYHLHSLFSGDCETPIADIINAAKKAGLTSLCLTDHNDLDHPPLPDGTDFNLDFDKYFPALVKLKEELGNGTSEMLSPGETFDYRIGIEQGVMPTTCEKLMNFSADHPELDFIICSTHFVEELDPYYPDFWEDKEPESAYRKYFEEMLYTVEHFKDYCVYGHLDYIFRYGPGPKREAEINVRKYMDVIEAILREIISSGKGIEINTGSLYRGMDYAHPHIEILKLYKELGGEILTFGSDAHDNIHLGYSFSDAAKLAKSLGFKYYCTYSQLKPTFVTLP
ncbi:MAG: histidinol-phosphatase HisJ family protein [Eubacterium sp.]|nr:histidinol-phosphatase HisJ family protein [Eubacterium sp.]